MSNERDTSGEPARLGPVGTFTYDAHSTITTAYDKTGRVVDRWAGPPKNTVPAPQQGATQATSGSATPRLRHCFEVRLCGVEASEQTLAVAAGDATTCLVAIERVRAFVTRDGQAAAAASPISGIEVQARLRNGLVACTAQLSDFPPGDLVVVQVEVALYAGGCQP
jgi:hypothetical protein